MNTVILIIDEPRLKEPYTKALVDLINYSLVWYYIFEVIIRIFAQGFCGGKGAFMKDHFNVFDFFLVIAMTTMLIIENYTQIGSNLAGDGQRIKQFTAAAKGLKMLRPLRLARTPALRDTLGSLVSSIPNLLAAWIINILFIYVFAILGVQLMCGRVSNCADLKYLNKVDCLAAN
jgi:hypothetical protein